VLKIKDEKSKAVVKPATKLVTLIPQFYMNLYKTYVLVGGIGGFGSIVRRARRSEVTNGY